MTAKKYRLEAVLGIRASAKTEAARQVADSLERLQTAEKELRRRRTNLQACRLRQSSAQSLLNEDLTKGIRARNILDHQNYLNDLRILENELQTAVEIQIHAVSKAESDLAAARQNLAKAAHELKSLEIHKANWQVTQLKEKTRREQKFSDEIGAILHERRRKK